MLIAQQWGPAPRLLLTLPMAVFTTLCLLYLMARLIQSDMPLVEIEYPPIPPVVMEPRKTKPPEIPKPELVEPPEPLPARPVHEWQPTEQVTEHITHNYELPRETTMATADNLPFARVMAPPVYPYRAASRGIEGFVDLRFDITASGATRNIQVVYAEPEGVFEESAKAAVARWRFQPKTVDGKAEPFVGLSKRVRFTMEK